MTEKLYHIMLYTSPWSRFELTTSVVIGTDSIGSCKFNYHTTMAMTAPKLFEEHRLGIMWSIRGNGFRQCKFRFDFMVFNATFNNISVKSCWSVLLVEETRVPGDNHQPVTSQRQSLSHVNFKRNITKIILHAIFDKKNNSFRR